MKALLLLPLLFTGCVIVNIPAEIPPNSNLSVSVAIYKSIAGNDGDALLETKTDADAAVDIPLVGEEQ